MTKLKDQIVALRSQGKTYNQIKDELNCSKGTIAYYLGEGVQEKQVRRQNVARNKLRVIIQKIKQESPCVDCGENYPYWVMDFDHLSDKSFNISQWARNRGADLDSLYKEIAKCDLVCSNCHRTRTHFRSKKTASKDMLDMSEYYPVAD